jgi:hypothetical protein
MGPVGRRLPTAALVLTTTSVLVWGLRLFFGFSFSLIEGSRICFAQARLAALHIEFCVAQPCGTDPQPSAAQTARGEIPFDSHSGGPRSVPVARGDRGA